MIELSKVYEAERAFFDGSDGQPLPKSYEYLEACLLEKDPGKDVALHFLFVAWYLLVEPPYLTGLNEAEIPSSSIRQSISRIFAYLDQFIWTDTEAAIVVAHMIYIAPYLFGDEKNALHVRERILKTVEQPDEKQKANIFGNRGFYGHYFSRVV